MARLPFRELHVGTQAFLLSGDPQFQTFIMGRYDFVGDPANFIRTACEVKSRSELQDNPTARAKFGALLTEFDAYRGFIAPQRTGTDR